jgi:hypothetical protein
MNYKGGCHCGQIAFEAEGELTQVIECNCSICSKKVRYFGVYRKANFACSRQRRKLAPIRLVRAESSIVFVPDVAFICLPKVLVNQQIL